MEWEKARKPQELKMLECYQDVMRIPREDDTKGTGAAKAKKAKGSSSARPATRCAQPGRRSTTPCSATGKMPFDTTPTNEKLAPYADAVEKILDRAVRAHGSSRPC
jgi:hypothetical protein